MKTYDEIELILFSKRLSALQYHFCISTLMILILLGLNLVTDISSEFEKTINKGFPTLV